MSVWIGGNSHAAGHVNQGNQYDPPDIDPYTGKLTPKHLEECTGCALCESDEPKQVIDDTADSDGS